MKTTRRTREQSVQLAIAALAASLCTGVTAQQFSDWAPAQPVAALNTTFNEGCPMESPDTLSLYFASTRPGMGGNDIWVARRADESSPWGSPENLGPPVNSPANEMCPTPLRGNGLLFVSDRPGSDACMAGPGRPDMYFARRNPAHGWVEAETLGCGSTDDGPNSVAAELTPSLAETPSGIFLYYSSDRAGGMDIYVSKLRPDGSFEPGTMVSELSSAYDDRTPNVSKDGRIIAFASNRPTGSGGATFGGQDIYISTRASTDEPWTPPVNAGAAVSTAGNETRPSLSWDLRRLYFGRDGDVYVSTRTRLTGAP
jgi:hypothetical protein